ncbi:unnamed protein product [Meloidogyne enterolobii]|uniref:Uncharacterized protein n=1 Tax=Meloidogyne enterolobii TaxID=390850 RepID=A0ACB0YNK3_MELEN
MGRIYFHGTHKLDKSHFLFHQTIISSFVSFYCCYFLFHFCPQFFLFTFARRLALTLLFDLTFTKRNRGILPKLFSIARTAFFLLPFI